MRKAMSTYVFVKQRLHPGLLDTLAKGGAEAIEIFAARGHFDYTDRAHVKEIADWFKSSSVKFNSMHSPMFSDADWGRDGTPPVNPVASDKRRRIESMDEIKRAIEVAEVVPFRYLVQHMGTGGEAFDPRKFEAGLSSLEHLHAFARPLGVQILVENIPNELSTPEKLVEFIHTLHFDDLGVCFDVGHAHLEEGVAASFEQLKQHIRSTHLHDNQKDRDSHLWPGDGSIDWKETLALLRTAPAVPPLLMEIEGEQGDVVENMIASYRRLDAAEAAAG